MSKFTSRVLLVTLEPIAKQMAGPAIRCVEIAKELAKDHEVTIFSPYKSDFKNSSEFSEENHINIYCGAKKNDLYRLAAQKDIIFIQANVLKPYPGLSDLGKYIVVDLYDPYLLSVLAQFEHNSVSSTASYRFMHQILNKHLCLADFAVCASEKQLDYWLGRFCSMGRLNPEMYAYDPSFRKLIDVLPFGLPDATPQRTDKGIKGKIPGIESNDFLLLWGGGIWEWFDPLTIIEAVSRLCTEYPQLKLYFMGIKSPNPQVPDMRMVTEAQELARQRGILNKHIFFAKDWTAYHERVNCLLDADLAVSAHFDTVETRFSFRTRILDYLWANLPILTSMGDELAQQIQNYQAGIALPIKDINAWEQAIKQCILDKTLLEKYKEGSNNLAKIYQWSKVIKPLQNFCAEPYHTPVFKSIKMPNIIERAKAVYERGGKDLVYKKSQELLKDLLQG